MKKFVLSTSIIFLVTIQLCTAQQWTGNNNITDAIIRSGSVGIGTTTNPLGFISLMISGLSDPDITLEERNATTNEKLWQILANGGRFRIITEADGYSAIQDAFIIDRDGVNVSTVSFPAGNVGIGTVNTGSFKLAVEGKVGAREVQVTLTNPWPDYVFRSNYNLMSLEELQLFIAMHKHLPEVPSAEEVKANGQNLGEMNALLLKKVEELTLYLIDLKKENNDLKKRLDALESTR